MVRSDFDRAVPYSMTGQPICATTKTRKMPFGGNLLGHPRWSLLFVQKGGFGMERFTELPAAVEGGACIGLFRHEVPLALLAAIETVQPVNFSLLPSLAALNGWRVNEGDRSLSDDLLA
ncbi:MULTISPECIES: hypothetical protein [unclassified Mesorhizobium]|jgi:hypothetical protein|uniref:hypothetical protein n=1 Tax=unclassified Mesorhizobium TaxID=325217 RepID=UPI00138F2ECA|nr:MULTISPECIES: hypothetical protein [unclassified Mesorhizobium]